MKFFLTALSVLLMSLSLATDALAEEPADDLRPANVLEFSAMTSQLNKWFDFEQSGIETTRVSPALAFGVAYVSVYGSPRVAVFRVFPDSDAELKFVAEGVECDELHEAGIDDRTSEALGIAGPDYCSEGRPRFLPRARVAELLRIRARANSAITAINRCKTASCTRKRYYRRYVPSTRRLEDRTAGLVEKISWSRCSVGLEGVHDATKAHRKALGKLLRAVARGDIYGQVEADDALDNSVKKSRESWPEVRSKCTYEP